MSIIGYNNLIVLKEKINSQVDSVVNKNIGHETTRFGSSILLANLSLKSPYIGYGFATNRKDFENLIYNEGYIYDIGIGSGMFLF